MEVLEGEALRRRIFRDYSRDTKGWSFVVSPSPGSGFFDATVTGPEGSWMLKIDSVFKPQPIVVGSLSETSPRRVEGPIPYGYRALPPDLALRIMRSEGSGRRDRTLRALRPVLRSEPVVPEQGASYAEGPVILTGPRIDLSDKQTEIDAALSSEMRRLLRLRYPAYG